jgi:hypothetical protein
MSFQRIIELQELLMVKLHPTFVKGGISICIGAITFLSIFFSGDETAKYLSAFVLWIIKGVLGLVGITLNQFRDAISAYYTEKGKKLNENITNVSSGNVGNK